MWDGPRSGAGRSMRASDPAASRRGPTGQTGRHPAGPRQQPDYPQNPYRPYGEQSAPRVPAYRLPPGVPADPSMSTGWTEAEMQAVHHRMGVAIFHDGNPGHLWRGELASRLGEATLAAGMVIWLYDLIGTPLAIALAVVAFGVPFLIAPLLIATFENSPEPGVPLKWIGRVRFVFALGLIAMHYHTILPIVYGLLFIISLCGRLREGARVAAMRTCLAPGEPEHVANDTYVGAAVAAVVGPLLATLFYVITGERILGVSIGAAVFFLISFNSESFLDALPPARRAFLLATPESVAVDDAALASLSEDDVEDLDPDERREVKLPEWYQQGPSSAWQAVSDILVGLGLAGSTPVSTAALWALGALAFVGGGLSVLEVFYVTSIVSMPAFYLGPLLAAEGAGLALGVSLAGGLPGSRAPRIGIVIGLVSSGAALALLALLPELPIVLLVALGLGLANALAVSAARNALILRFDGVERRALASCEQWTTALCGVAGALLFTFFFTGPEGVPIHLPSHLLPSWPLPALLLLTAGGLAAAGPLLAVASPPSGRRRAKKAGKKAKPGASGSRVRAPDDEDIDGFRGEDDSAYLPATGAHVAWDGEAGDDGDWDEGYSEQYPAQRTGYGQAYDTGGYDAYEGEDDPRRGPPARRPAPRRNRPRW